MLRGIHLHQACSCTVIVCSYNLCVSIPNSTYLLAFSCPVTGQLATAARRLHPIPMHPAGRTLRSRALKRVRRALCSGHDI